MGFEKGCVLLGRGREEIFGMKGMEWEGRGGKRSEWEGRDGCVWGGFLLELEW